MEEEGIRESWERTPSWIPGFCVATFTQSPYSLEVPYQALRLCRATHGLERDYCCKFPASET